MNIRYPIYEGVYRILTLVRPRSCHRRLVFQTQIWTAALDFIALKCISRKILPFRERVIFRKKR